MKEMCTVLAPTILAVSDVITRKEMKLPLHYCSTSSATGQYRRCHVEITMWWLSRNIKKCSPGDVENLVCGILERGRFTKADWRPCENRKISNTTIHIL